MNKLPSRTQRLTVLALLFAIALSGLPLFNVSAAGTISGRVFQDFNQNGIYDTSGVSPNFAIDKGIANVTVTAYDSTDVIRGTATSIAAGTYSLSATGTGPYRLEFTTLPSGYLPSARSTDSVTGGTATNTGSAVQFVNDGVTANVNLAVNHPSNYSQNNPNYAIAKLGHGNPTDASNTAIPALFRFPYDATGNSPNASRSTLRNAPNVGSIWGLAWNRSNSLLYASSVLKRHTGIGPNGLGAIYQITNANSGAPSSSLFFDFGATAGTIATNATRFSSGTGSTGAYTGDNIDASVFVDVAKKGLGDIDVSDDGTTLYATNLNDRKVYSINTSGTPAATEPLGIKILSWQPLRRSCL
jgi:trimeric autotransporter adhesin